MLHLLLACLFCNHMVLQRDQPNPVWGWDKPGQEIVLTVEQGPVAVAPIHARAAADGSWRLELPALPAGGPYRLRISGSEQRVIDDVLVGEVWLASGQSNMEWPLVNTDGADKDLAAANDPELREFKVQRATSRVPASEAAGEWRTSSPATAGDFSAVAYHFARQLRDRLHVPVGIINSSWGGTNIEPWTSVPALRMAYDVDAEVARLAALEPERPQLEAAFQKKQRAWELVTFPRDTGIAPESRAWADPATGDASWKTLSLPVYWQRAGLNFNGAIWFRLHVAVPAAWAGKDLLLNLGPIDDFDITFFNGTQVGSVPQGTAGSYMLPRSYRVPGSLVKAGDNVIAVRVFDQGGDGGFGGAVSTMTLGQADGGPTLALAGAWRYRVEREIPLVQVDWASAPAPDYPQEQDRPAALFNGMIAPLIPYGIRGAIWYQGENNAGAPLHYSEKFTALIRDWRTRWGEGQFPFLFVQLANFKANAGWPRLREQQAMTLAEPSTGMAVIIDIGNPDNIHPRNKREVGRRLALLARAMTYGERSLETSGPVLDRVDFAAGAARVHWTHAEGLRTRDGAAEVTGFELAGPDGRFVAATGRIQKDGTITVASPAVPAPCALRYDFQDSPDGNLENAARLPARPFRTDAD